jgi:hypothetical protein
MSGSIKSMGFDRLPKRNGFVPDAMTPVVSFEADSTVGDDA